MEQENYETSDCYSFFQVLAIKIFECIQNLIQVSTSQNLARRGRGGNCDRLVDFGFCPTKKMTLLTIHSSSLDILV